MYHLLSRLSIQLLSNPNNKTSHLNNPFNRLQLCLHLQLFHKFLSLPSEIVKF